MDYSFLRFIPLVVWALGLLALSTVDCHLRQIDGRPELTEEEREAFAKLWWMGVLFFIVAGVFA